jgi:hypothetical protein
LIRIAQDSYCVTPDDHGSLELSLAYRVLIWAKE